MAWVVTLEITDCNSHAPLAYASINDGYNYYTADANGQFIAVVDDSYTGYIIQISASNHISKNYALSSGQNGTIQNVCLSPSPTGGGGGTTSGGW